MAKVRNLMDDQLGFFKGLRFAIPLAIILWMVIIWVIVVIVKLVRIF